MLQMQLLLLLTFFTFIVSLVFTPLCRDLFRRWDLFDRPDVARKIHTEPIPRVGGVVLVLSLLTTYVVALFLDQSFKPITGAGIGLLWKVLPGAAVIFVTGLLDDLIALKAWQKLAGQLIGAGWAYWAGLRVAGIAGHAAPGWLALPVTVFWLVLCTNAFNLIDGVDGLATGVGLFAILTMMLAAIIQHNLALAAVTLPLAGFLLGFLRYNFNPATVFLGDSGSLLIGFLLGCFGVIWSQKSATLLGMTAPLMAMFVPILDVGLSVMRRFLAHQPIFGADRGHIHHRLLDRGMTPRRTVLLLYGACSLGAVFSIVQTVSYRQFGGLIVLIFCAATWIGVQHLGYVEFGLASRMLLSGSFQRLIESQLQLRKLEHDLQAAATVEDCWCVLADACRTFGFDAFAVSFGDHTFKQDLSADNAACWTIRIPLSDVGYVNLERRLDSLAQSFVIASLVEIIRKHMAVKLESFIVETPERPESLAHSAK